MTTRSRHPRQISIPSLRQGTLRGVAARLVAFLAVTALIVTGFAQAVPSAQAAPTDVQAITIKGADVDAAALNRNGLTYKGFGLLTANATSALLLDYKSQHPDKYWELLATLFGGDYPIMNTIKIEMGNDRNTSTGPNAATMRSRDEYPNVQREPGFQLAADAQLVAQGDLHVSILRWNRPTWVTSDADQYIWFKNTVLAAYREYGVMVDSINPDTNETGSPNVALYKTFSNWLRTDTTGYQGATAGDPNNGFASQAEQDLYRSIKTVAADTVGTPSTSFSNQMVSSTDPSLRDAVDVVGFHYSTSDDANGNLKKLADVFDKEIWNSEGQSTFSNSADRPNNTSSDGQGGVGTEMGGVNGPLEMSNWITSGFEKSRRTLHIFQPAIGSFYDGSQYSSKELVSARDPWSGWLYYDGGLAALEQYSQFAKLGWENSTNTAGIWRGIPQASGTGLGGGNPPSGAQNGVASYTTLAAPDKSDFSTVIVNDSSFTKTYQITASNLSLGSDPTMEVWETRAADAGEAYDANYVHPVAEIAPQGGTYTVTVKPWSTVTATTLDHATTVGGILVPRSGFGSSAPTSPEYTKADGGRDVLDTDASGNVNGVTDDAFLYADDFDYREAAPIQTYDPATGQLSASTETFLDSRGAKAKPSGTPAVQPEDNGATPRYTMDTNGAFESVLTDDPAHGRVLRQQVGPGMDGSAWNGGDPKTTIGDFRWANYRVSVDAFIGDTSNAYASVGAREMGGTANGQGVSAAELKVTTTGAWTFMRYGATVSSGNASSKPETNFQPGNAWNNLAVQVAGTTYTASINGVQVAAYTDTAPEATGRIQLGSAFTFTQFDNLKVEKVAGYTPYYSTVIDGMHQTSWENVSTPVLVFNNKWNHINGQGMFEWQRTASNSTGKGASLTYTFTGTGLDVLGTNGGSARLNVTVDGVLIASNQPTWPAGAERTTFTLRGLKNGQHTVVLETATADPLNVDAVGVVTANADSAAVDTTGLHAAVNAVVALNEDDWSPASWAVFADVFADAKAADTDPVAYGLDAEGASALTSRLAAAAQQLVPKGVSVDVRDLGVIAVTAGQALPGTVTLDGNDVAVTWDSGAAQSVAATAELGKVQVTGRTSDKVQPSGLYQRFTVAVLVNPTDLKYFIDSGSTSSAAGSTYAAVKASQPGLLNDAADRKWSGSDATTTWGYSTTSTTGTAAGSAADWSSSYVAADFNKPVIYHLSLPAGTFTIVTVQAPRPGLTTNFYSTVTAGSYQNKVTAVSTGGATPISQQVTLTQPTVVNVEFGTNGTSGYNGRLALVEVQAVPRDLGFQGALSATSTLPSTVSVDGSPVAVTWEAASAAQARADYTPIAVRGTVGAGATAATVIAHYEVVPEQLRYYIDSGTGGVDSPQYAAVKAAVPTLINDKVDQVSSSADQWGYLADGTQVKAGTAIGDKYSTGLYQDTTRMVYRLPLPAGTYTLTAGFIEWWNVTRTMNQTVSVNGKELAKGNIALSGSNSPLSGDLAFTLTEPATVEYTVTNEGAGSEKPVISWLAVAAKADKSSLLTAMNAADGLAQAHYTATSWNGLVTALTVARQVFADGSATPEQIATAAANLADAESSLVSLEVLQAAVSLADSLTETDFTPETWAPFAAAHQAAAAVLANPDSSRSEVDASTVALLAAQLVLAPLVDIDTTVLEAALAVADGLTEGDYTAGSWSAFIEARDAAHAVLAAVVTPPAAPTARAAATSQADVTQATTDLLAAQSKLVSIAALAATINTAAALVEHDYTAPSWAAYASALAAAQAVLADADATQAEVDDALGALADAIAQLDDFVYTATLAALVASAGQLAEPDYTPASWAPLAQALAAAKAVLADPSATQGQVDAAALALAAARDGLADVVPDPVDKTGLQLAIGSAQSLVWSDYSPASWAAFAQALATARGVLADPTATQPQVDAARSALLTAQGALVAADPTQSGGQTPLRDGSELASTGVNGWPGLALALLLLALGGGVALVKRRTRQVPADSAS